MLTPGEPAGAMPWIPDVWELLHTAGVAWNVAAGERVVTREGPRGATVFVVVEGVCAVMHGDVVRRVLGPGEVFGEMGWLLARPRSADVVAVRPCRLLAFEPDVLERLHREKAGLMAGCYRTIAAQLAERTVTVGGHDAG